MYYKHCGFDINRKLGILVFAVGARLVFYGGGFSLILPLQVVTRSLNISLKTVPLDKRDERSGGRLKMVTQKLFCKENKPRQSIF